MFHITKAINCDHRKHPELNVEFASVLNEKNDYEIPEACDNTSTKLDDFRLSGSDVEYLLRICPDSSACGDDNISPFVRNSYSDILDPFAFDLFSWNIQNRTL